jgi:hypothetical protein
MDVAEAVTTAKKHILKLLEDEKILNLRLEEAFFDESQGVWHITLGFSRAGDTPGSIQSVQEMLNKKIQLEYNILEVPDDTNKKICLKNHAM